METQRRGAASERPQLLNPGTFLTREQAAEALTAAGIPATRQSLEHLSRVKKGPPYVRMLNRTLYQRADLEAWIRSQPSSAGVAAGAA